MDFPFHLADHARQWYDHLPPQADFGALKTSFLAAFQEKDDISYISIRQLPSESVNSYFLRLMSKRPPPTEMGENLATQVAVGGLLASLRQIVMPQGHQTMEAARRAAILAEQTVTSASETVANVTPQTLIVEELKEVVKLLRNIKPTNHTQGNPNYYQEHEHQ